MKKFAYLLFAISIMAVLGFANSVFAELGEGKVIVLAPVGVGAGADGLVLDFASAEKDTTITINNDGTWTKTGGTVLGTPTGDVLEVSGSDTVHLTLTQPTDCSNGVSLTVTMASDTATPDVGVNDLIGVGGKMVVPVDAVTGLATCSFTITAAY